LESHINPYLFAGGDMFYLTSGLYRELDRVAIGTMDNPDAFDLLGGEGSNLLFLVAYQSQATNATAINEADMLAIRFDLPAGLLVFYGTVIVLELGIALLAGLLVLAVLIETGDSEPGSISTRLSGLRVETGGKEVLTGKRRTVALQVILVDAPLIHPQAQALVPDELHNPDSFINGLILLFAPVEFVLLNEHPLALLYFLCYTDYTAIYSVRQEGKQMKRTNFYLTEKQVERLHQRAEKEGLAVSELIRRAVDAFLAWDDPTYLPQPTPQTRKSHSSPA